MVAERHCEWMGVLMELDRIIRLFIAMMDDLSFDHADLAPTLWR